MDDILSELVDLESNRNNFINDIEKSTIENIDDKFNIGFSISNGTPGGVLSVRQTSGKFVMNEILEIKEEVEEKGKTIIPLNLYYKNGKVKIQFAIAKGRKLWDKRNYKKDQDVNREIDRAMKDIK